MTEAASKVVSPSKFLVTNTARFVFGKRRRKSLSPLIRLSFQSRSATYFASTGRGDLYTPVTKSTSLSAFKSKVLSNSFDHDRNY